MSHTVYVYRDSRDVVLYVGITGRGHRRAEEHASSKEWWPEVFSASFIHVATRQAALDLERALIQAFSPVGNTQHYEEPDGSVPVIRPEAFRRMMLRGGQTEKEPATLMTDAEWMALPKEAKYEVGCIACGTPRRKDWNGPRCPECLRPRVAV